MNILCINVDIDYCLQDLSGRYKTNSLTRGRASPECWLVELLVSSVLTETISLSFSLDGVLVLGAGTGVFLVSFLSPRPLSDCSGDSRSTQLSVFSPLWSSSCLLISMSSVVNQPSNSVDESALRTNFVFDFFFKTMYLTCSE